MKKLPKLRRCGSAIERNQSQKQGTDEDPVLGRGSCACVRNGHPNRRFWNHDLPRPLDNGLWRRFNIQCVDSE